MCLYACVCICMYMFINSKSEGEVYFDTKSCIFYINFARL